MALEKETVNEAVKGLYAYLERKSNPEAGKKSGKVKALFEDATDILLTLSLKKTPAEGRTKPYAVPVPHSLFGQEGQRVCVMTKDPQSEFEEMLLETPANRADNVTGVLSVTKLRKEFHEYKDRRDLLASYDLFLADDRVVPLLPRLLGNKFFHKKKQPVPVNLRAKNVRRELEKARDATYMWISTGSTIAVKVARSNMTRSQVVANVMAAIDGIVKRVPRKWNNVQQVFLKTHDSVALPLYSSLPDDDVVKAAPKAEEAVKKGGKRKGAEANDDDDDDDDAAAAKAPPKKKAKKKKSKAGSK